MKQRWKNNLKGLYSSTVILCFVLCMQIQLISAIRSNQIVHVSHKSDNKISLPSIKSFFDAQGYGRLFKKKKVKKLEFDFQNIIRLRSGGNDQISNTTQLHETDLLHGLHPSSQEHRNDPSNFDFTDSEGSRKFRSNVNKTTKNNEFNRFQVYLTCVTIVSIWVLTGTFFYSKINDWPIPQSFFYSVDAGMSIGFCTDVRETTIKSRAFTILHIILGASCVGGALVLFVADLMNEGIFHDKHFGEYKKLLEHDAFQRADRYHVGVLTYDQFHELVEAWIGNYVQVSNNYERKPKLVLDTKVFQKLCHKFDPKRKGRISYEDFMYLGYDGIDRLILYPSGGIYSKFWVRRIMAHTWDALSSAVVGENRIYTIFTLWIALGVSWGHWNQKWDVITSLHFAVSALATGGLTAPPVNDDGILPAGPAIFCGFYCLFGIPLFALTLGHFARILISKYIASASKMAIVKPLNKAEFEFAKYLCSSDKVIHMSDFVVLQLLRQGKVNMNTVVLIKKQFDMLDWDNSGTLSLDQATEGIHGADSFE